MKRSNIKTLSSEAVKHNLRKSSFNLNDDAIDFHIDDMAGMDMDTDTDTDSDTDTDTDVDMDRDTEDTDRTWIGIRI